MHEGVVEIRPISTLAHGKIGDVFLLECFSDAAQKKWSSCITGDNGACSCRVRGLFVLERADELWRLMSEWKQEVK